MTFEKINWRKGRVPNTFLADFDRLSARVAQSDDGSWWWTVSLDSDQLRGSAATKISAKALAERAMRYGA